VAVTKSGSSSLGTVDAATGYSTLNVAHTFSGELMLVFWAGEGSDDPRTTSPCTWDAGGGGEQDLAEIYLSADTGDARDVRLGIYGILNPTTTGADFLRWRTQFTENQCAIAIINLTGVDTTSLNDAVSVISSDSNTIASGATLTSVMASGGSSGDFGIAWGSSQADGASSVSAGWTSDQEGETGAAAGDSRFRLDTNASMPSGCTQTWSGSDENEGVLLAVHPAAGGTVAVQSMYHLRNHGKFY